MDPHQVRREPGRSGQQHHLRRRLRARHDNPIIYAALLLHRDGVAHPDLHRDHYPGLPVGQQRGDAQVTLLGYDAAHPLGLTLDNVVVDDLTSEKRHRERRDVTSVPAKRAFSRGDESYRGNISAGPRRRTPAPGSGDVLGWDELSSLVAVRWWASSFLGAACSPVLGFETGRQGTREGSCDDRSLEDSRVGWSRRMTVIVGRLSRSRFVGRWDKPAAT